MLSRLSNFLLISKCCTPEYCLTYALLSRWIWSKGFWFKKKQTNLVQNWFKGKSFDSRSYSMPHFRKCVMSAYILILLRFCIISTITQYHTHLRTIIAHRYPCLMDVASVTYDWPWMTNQKSAFHKSAWASCWSAARGRREWSNLKIKVRKN